MTHRIINFNPGPAALPLSVLESMQKELLDYDGTGMSVMEISHRSKQFADVLAGAKENVQTLLDLPDNYRVLYLP